MEGFSAWPYGSQEWLETIEAKMCAIDVQFGGHYQNGNTVTSWVRLMMKRTFARSKPFWGPGTSVKRARCTIDKHAPLAMDYALKIQGQSLARPQVSPRIEDNLQLSAADLAEAQSRLQENLRVSAGFVVPGCGVFKYGSPVFNDYGDLLVEVQYQ
ncbi:uncharacterized protein BDV14DRAFT_201692 [Aspergillus stella-maris]|uniref:uncharacterized protein n=1 Tax=Aspergillus stella-maris TaxID=1810926 RepID=UPI003CCD8951